MSKDLVAGKNRNHGKLEAERRRRKRLDARARSCRRRGLRCQSADVGPVAPRPPNPGPRDVPAALEALRQAERVLLTGNRPTAALLLAEAIRMVERAAAWIDRPCPECGERRMPICPACLYGQDEMAAWDEYDDDED